jgi:hypothetical protein
MHRRIGTPPDGVYLTLDQSSRSSRLAQAALFGFSP